jgi:hypothetical protein
MICSKGDVAIGARGIPGECEFDRGRMATQVKWYQSIITIVGFGPAGVSIEFGENTYWAPSPALSRVSRSFSINLGFLAIHPSPSHVLIHLFFHFLVLMAGSGDWLLASFPHRRHYLGIMQSDPLLSFPFLPSGQCGSESFPAFAALGDLSR